MCYVCDLRYACQWKQSKIEKRAADVSLDVKQVMSTLVDIADMNPEILEALMEVKYVCIYVSVCIHTYSRVSIYVLVSVCLWCMYTIGQANETCAPPRSHRCR